MSAIASELAASGVGRRASLPILVAVAASLLSGCAALKRDHVIVGSVPDDYRTNHPIVIGEKQESIDIPVAYDGYRMTRQQRDLVEGFLYRYDRSAAPPVTIVVPSGSANSAAASNVAADLGHLMKRNGVSEVFVASYQVDQPDVSAPVRITYTAIRASTGKCGRWPADLMENSENKHYADFGCSSQNNLAAQVANPHDLIGPRQPGEIDAERRAISIDDYQQQLSEWSPTIDY